MTFSDYAGPPPLEEFLAAELEGLRQKDLHRGLRRIDSPQSPRVELEGRTLLNFSSNDYLGLANDPRLKAAATRAVEQWGAGSGASRLISGSLAPHLELEAALADFKGAQAALVFSTGYAAALGTVPAIVGAGDIVIVDKLIHACLIDAARLSGATLRAYRHNDLNSLEQLLRWARQKGGSPAPRVLVVTESVFSMDGDLAPLKEIAALKEQYGAWLMVDEAHATGLYGPHRRGWIEAQEVADRVEIQMGTLSKALGASGGYICGSRRLIELLVNRARSFIFSTAPVPAAAGAAREAIRLVRSEDGASRREQLWQRLAQLGRGLEAELAPAAPIVPIVVGDPVRALTAAAALRERGLFVPAIRFPTVPRKQARLRISVSAGHAPADIVALIDALRQTLT